MTRSISAKAISGLVRAARCSTGTPARFKRTGLLVQLSGTKRRNATMTGTSPRASVSDTNVWQLAVLPRDEAYCGATPTERSPFFGIAVSSMTSTASFADQAIGLNQQFRLQWRCIPNAISNEMVQLVILARCQPCRHRLDALAITRSNQS